MPSPSLVFGRQGIGEFAKKLALARFAILAILRIPGCAQYVGKGKVLPPVVTKG